METNGKKNVKIQAPPAVSFSAASSPLLVPTETPRQVFERLLEQTKDPARRESLFREQIKLLDAELAAERTEVKNSKVATYTITQVAIAFVSGILSGAEFQVSDAEQAIKLDDELTNKVKGLKLELATSNTGDLYVRIRERGDPDSVILRGGA